MNLEIYQTQKVINLIVYTQVAKNLFGLIIGLNSTDGSVIGARYKPLQTSSSYAPIFIINSKVYVEYDISSRFTIMVFDLNLNVVNVYQSGSLRIKGKI